MGELEDRLEEINWDKEEILRLIDERNASRTIDCASCDESHPIRELTAIQTHYYVPPTGCTEGAYWLQGELQYICPVSNVVNRLLFFNNDVPWEERKFFKNNPAHQFSRTYKKLFAEVIDDYDEIKERPVNNLYVDRHREEFGLVKKRESS